MPTEPLFWFSPAFPGSQTKWNKISFYPSPLPQQPDGQNLWLHLDNQQETETTQELPSFSVYPESHPHVLVRTPGSLPFRWISLEAPNSSTQSVKLNKDPPTILPGSSANFLPSEFSLEGTEGKPAQTALLKSLLDPWCIAPRSFSGQSSFHQMALLEAPLPKSLALRMRLGKPERQINKICWNKEANTSQTRPRLKSYKGSSTCKSNSDALCPQSSCGNSFVAIELEHREWTSMPEL